MIHIVDQYGAGGSYGAGADFSVTYDTTATLQDADIFTNLTARLKNSIESQK